jgi:hypothetical protein
VREPAVHPTSAAHALDLLRQGGAWLRHEPVFRRLLVARATLSIWLAASPFLTCRPRPGRRRARRGHAAVRPHARLRGVEPAVAAAVGVRGRTILKICIARVLMSSAAWRRSGERASWARAALLALEGIAVLGGAASCGLTVGYRPWRSRRRRRERSRLSVLSTFIGPTMFPPMLGGMLVDALNARYCSSPAGWRRSPATGRRRDTRPRGARSTPRCGGVEVEALMRGCS